MLIDPLRLLNGLLFIPAQTLAESLHLLDPNITVEEKRLKKIVKMQAIA